MSAPDVVEQPPLDLSRLDAWLREALAEDVGAGDRTTRAVGLEDVPARAVVEAQQELTVAGLGLACRVFGLLDPAVRIDVIVPDGEAVAAGRELARIEGRLGPLLAGERLCLNVLGHLCGVASATRRYVDAVAGTGARIADTRKTLPLMRALEKHAVRMGGGESHRAGLYDAILIKNNHVDGAGGIGAALERVRASGDPGPVEVEVRDLDELDEALAFAPDWVLLDNFDLGATREAVARTRERVPEARIEASGSMRLDRVRAVAETGVDRISVGALTHSAPWADVHMVISLPGRA